MYINSKAAMKNLSKEAAKKSLTHKKEMNNYYFEMYIDVYYIVILKKT